MSSVRAVFDRSAQIYNRARRQLVPCFDDFYDALLRIIPFPADAELRVLDLGAGTGLLSLFVANKFPRSHVTLLDLSAQMLDKARARLAEHSDRCTFMLADFSERELPGPFDVVVSALAIHHLRDAHKAALFHRIYGCLAEPGAFINADQVLGATPAIERRQRQAWLDQVREHGVDPIDLAAALERMKEDRMATLPAQLQWVKEAGFHTVNCWYQSFMFAVYSGYKGNISQAEGS